MNLVLSCHFLGSYPYYHKQSIATPVNSSVYLPLLIKQSKHNENFVVFALIPLENKDFAKTLQKLSIKNIFGISDTIGMRYETMHETLTNVKKRSKTNFLPNFVSVGCRGRSPHEVKLDAKLWDKVVKKWQ